MLYRSYVKQKASNWTPFVFIALLFSTSALSANPCAITQNFENVKVAQVYDGDTVKLRDGRKVRLIGINTPERGRDGKKDEPFYLAAKNQLQNIIKKNNNVKIVLGKSKHDRYKRLLAHLFTIKNENITATLLRSGMGFMIAIPPNIKFLDCYKNAEDEARIQKRGIWNHSYSDAINITSLEQSARGFHRLTGKVDRIGESRSSVWLNLNSKSGEKFALRILKKALPYFVEYHPKELLNRQLTARGWIYEINNEQRMTIHHPAALEIGATD